MVESTNLPAVTSPNDLVVSSQLTPEETAKAAEIAKGFDPRASNAILQFAVAPQKKLGDVADPLLQKVKTKDTGPAGEALTELMARVKEVNVDSLSGQAESFLSNLPLIGSAFNHVQQFISRYEKIAVKIDRIVDELKGARQTMLTDITQLDLLYAQNAASFREMLVYIRAGELKLEEMRTQLEALKAQAAATNDMATAQQVRDLADLTTRLEKRVYDLKLTAMITLQTAPQIRLVQSSDQVLVEKIQSSILTTIPLWKNQIVIAISLFNQKKALELQRAVTDTTNDLLARNAALLQQGVTDVARESERGVVEIATLQEVNNRLIATIEETLQIQEEGRRKRQEAEGQLQEMQGQLRQALVQARDL
jgi:uncharacterized protein YaaN involved in tellurite resistance